ncbi:hypothetical protein C8039_11625 [Halogeometricum sp. wsp3]|nr:hypothetical protein C8039_11625 [Halogeometricum sp. wsp3]
MTVGALEDGFYVEDDWTWNPARGAGRRLRTGYTTPRTGPDSVSRIVRKSSRPTDGQLPSLTAARRRAVRIRGIETT